MKTRVIIFALAMALLLAVTGCISTGMTTQRQSPLPGVNAVITTTPDGDRQTNIVVSGDAKATIKADGSIDATSSGSGQQLLDLIRQ